MPVTHQEIAKRLGVSRTLVTGALHGTRGAGISTETQELVLRTAREMGYVPRNRTTHTIGLVVHGSLLGSEGLGAFLRETEAALQRRNYRMTVMTVWNHQLAPLQDLITPKSVDGVIVTESFKNRVLEFLPPEVPSVLTYDEDDISPTHDVVAMDGAATMENITRMLLDQGHRQIALMSVKDPSIFYRRLERGVRQALDQAGLSQQSLRVLELDYGPQGNIEPDRFTRDLLDGLRQPVACTAAIATDLWRALPAVQALSAGGLRMPHDISFVSLWDSAYFEAMNPPITATNVYAKGQAVRVVERLLEKIEQPNSTPRHEYIRGEIIHRGSVAPPPGINHLEQ